MIYLRLSLLLSFVFMVSACGVGSIYGPSYYSDTNLGEKLRRVTFRGGFHPNTGELCLLRCAEVCLEEGYFFFEVVDSESGSSLETHDVSFPFDSHYPSRDRFMDDIPFVSKTIRLLSSEPDEGFAYNAREIKSSLRRKYEIN